MLKHLNVSEKIKTAIIELDVKPGCFEQNFNNAVKWISQAKAAGTELVILPEMCLSGYFLGDKWLDDDFLELSKKYAEKLIEASQGIALIFGAAYEKHNCAYICENGKLLHRYAKKSLQNYGIYDEQRYFLPGTEKGVAEIRGTKIGIEIGDDFCDDPNVDFIVNISAKPWPLKKKKKEKTIYANCSGCQNTGKNILVFADESTTPQQIIQRAYKGIDEMLGFEPKYVFGLSGGIDSALACALAVKALGKERVIAYNFPGEYSSEKTKKAAEQLAKNLGIEYNVVPIVGIQKEVEAALGKFPSIVKENIQAKIRYTDLLSNFAQIHGGVMTCNSNKLEIALGYCTLYGDTGGIFAPLGDLLKAEIFEIARAIEEIPRELIPNEDLIFEDWQIYPSAELSSGQRDPMKFGYHDKLLDAIMSRKLSFSQAREYYKQGKLFSFLELPQQLIQLYNLNNLQIFESDLEWFSKQFNSSAFKRIQMPPILMMSNCVFGRESLLLKMHTT
ncbi:MAG: NAD(+) synthase [Fibromonadaceae bacterium]|nr:NAD(+) synthase [Fibromonadaceae bacterium]